MKPLNAAIAERSHYSRRHASELIKHGRVWVNGQLAHIGDRVSLDAKIQIDGEALTSQPLLYVALNKPVGYECSKQPQGKNPSVYNLLPAEYHNLNYAGRLDVDSRGLVIFTNDGQWLQELTHPSYAIKRVYDIKLNKPLSSEHKKLICEGVELEDGISRLELTGHDMNWQASLKEGRKRQVRRTFKELGYIVTDLKRIRHGKVLLDDLKEGAYALIPDKQR